MSGRLDQRGLGEPAAAAAAAAAAAITRRDLSEKKVKAITYVGKTPGSNALSQKISITRRIRRVHKIYRTCCCGCVHGALWSKRFVRADARS